MVADSSELYDAALTSNVETVEALVAGGTSVDEQGDLGSPLHVAAARGDLAIAEILVAKGADIEALKGASSTRPLHEAASYGNVNIAKLLVAKGAKIEVRNDRGSTPLLEAAQNRHADVVKVLLSHGAEINAANIRHDTALHLAPNNRQSDLAVLLISRGADPSRPGRYEETPLHWAASFGMLISALHSTERIPKPGMPAAELLSNSIGGEGNPGGRTAAAAGSIRIDGEITRCAA